MISDSGNKNQKAPLRFKVAGSALIVAVSLVLTEIGLRFIDPWQNDGRLDKQWYEAIGKNGEKSWLLCYPSDSPGGFAVDLRKDAGRYARLAMKNVEERPHCAPSGRHPRAALTASVEEIRGSLRAVGKIPAVAIGDSFTFGEGVEEGEAWPARLESLFDDPAASDGFQVVNLGAVGADFPEIYENLFKKALALQPKAILYLYVINDVQQTPESTERFGFINDFINFRRSLLAGEQAPGPLGRSAVLRSLSYIRKKRRNQRETVEWYDSLYFSDVNREGVERTRRAFENMNREAAEAGAKFYIAVSPVFFNLKHYPFRDVHRAVMDMCGDAGADCVDLLDVFEGRDAARFQVHRYDFHPNARAHALIAENFHRRLKGRFGD